MDYPDTCYHLRNRKNRMKLCQIYNGASAYRESIYRLLDEEFDTDWVFGKSLGDIKFMDISVLKGKVEFVKNISLFGNTAYWQTGVLKYLFCTYTHYIVLGDERCLSTWIFLLLSLLFPKKKIYFWSHGQYGREGAIKKVIEKIFWSFTDGAFLYGNYAKNIMVKNEFKAEKLHIVHNSLAYDHQLELRKSGLESDIYKNHFRNNNPTLIFIGRLTKVKKLDQLLKAVSNLKRKRETYNIVFIGDGEEHNNLENKAKELNISSQIWFYGACYDENVNAELVYNADLCVAPGNVGLTAIHCLMFGCPVLTHNDFPWQMPEFEAIHEGVTGCFFTRDDVNSLVESISNWFKQKSNYREEIRRSCYDEIDTQWNPYFQIKVFKEVLK